MKRFISTATIAIAAITAMADSVSSPDGRICFDLQTSPEGKPFYTVSFDGKPVIAPSGLGLTAKEVSFGDNVTIQAGPVGSHDTVWQPVWGEYADIREHYNERAYRLTDKLNPARVFTLRVRVFDDGLGFRYEIDPLPGIPYLTFTGEQTEFRLPHDMTAWAIPGDYDTDERLYTTSAVSTLGSNLKRPAHGESSLIPGLAVQTPVMLKGGKDGNLYLNIHEAALQGYGSMALDVDTATLTFTSHISPDVHGVTAYVQPAFHTPWRTLIIADNGPDILASQLIYNLNEPCRIADTSWIKPQKFLGVWWEMFTGNQKTWAYADAPQAKPGITDYSSLKPNGRHPANNDNVKRYIDFAAENGIPAVLVEGWNEGWEDWTGYGKNRQYLFDKPYPDFDVDMLTAYAKEKGVSLIMHHETAANAADYERQLDRAFTFMKDHGYNSVKTGYVGKVIPRSESHSTQWMVDHYIHVAKRAADFGIMVDSHEAVRPTGMARTWPNWVAQESARGGEWESMGGNTPEHTVILPFTRLKGGPMDYTPGLFENDLAYYGQGKTSHGGTTLAKQLALYLTMYSPLQMACDLPENYRRFPDAFQFIKDVPVDWADTRFLEAEPGDYITVARRDKNSADWYVGAITDENPRTASVSLDFLPAGKYEATIYEDAPGASWDKAPQRYRIRTVSVTPKTRLKLSLALGGGTAIRITPKK